MPNMTRESENNGADNMVQHVLTTGDKITHARPADYKHDDKRSAGVEERNWERNSSAPKYTVPSNRHDATIYRTSNQ